HAHKQLLHADKKQNEAQRQIACADRILINKIDLVKDVEEIRKLEVLIRTINPFAEIQQASRASYAFSILCKTTLVSKV
ncbi:hypothetical protein NL438_26790, partial [Klebsiella pneumoniae]|nr:hypothetical protein [Klebsiella pneumoniae]